MKWCFTKEELGDIEFCILEVISQGSIDSTWNKDIRDLKEKVSLMMDNHWDHCDLPKDMQKEDKS